jgi:uncharacterized protein GlcG (DUF336 family)
MKPIRRSWRAIPLLALALTLALTRAGLAQAPKLPEQTISLAEARMIIDGTIAHGREKNLRLGVVVLDASGEMVAGEHTDGAPGRNIMFAQGKAYASVMYRASTTTLAQLYKTRPDRYFGILNMYGSKVYLVDGGLPLVADGKLVGAVGVAGTPGQDEECAQAGIVAWEKARPARK